MIGVEIVGDGRYRVPTPGGGRVVASRVEVAAWARQVGGDGHFWAEVLSSIESHEALR